MSGGAGPNEEEGERGRFAPGRSGREPADRTADEAHGVEMSIYPEQSRWAVDITVLFPDGVVRRRIDTYHTKERAEISAKYIKRAAERNLRGPLNG